MSYNELNTRIMKRVYTIHALRRLASPFGLRFWLFLISVSPVFAFVSIRQVMANLPPITDSGALYSFGESALLNTELAVQVGVLVIGLILVFTLRDLLRARQNWQVA